MAGIAKRAKRRLNAEINVVPYIDVMLVLLIIFMITAPLLSQGVEVDLPEVAETESNVSEDPLVVTVDAKGSFFLSHGEQGEREPVTDAEVVRVARIFLRNNPRPDQQVVYIRGDEDVPYGRIMAAMSLLKQAGADKVGLPTEPSDTK
ncbi:MAG: protein TolR [Nevskiales bacterium]